MIPHRQWLFSGTLLVHYFSIYSVLKRAETVFLTKFICFLILVIIPNILENP